MIKKIPKELKELQKPWVNGSYRAIRFGGHFRKCPDIYLIEYLTGGAGTIIGKTVDKEIYIKIKKLMDIEFLKDEGNKEHKKNLENLLSQQNIQLIVKNPYINPIFTRAKIIDMKHFSIPSEVFRLNKLTYELLPEHHLNNPYLKILKLGGWGGGAAKFGEYDSPKVHIFECVTLCSRRNFLALLLHETGHAFEKHLLLNDPRGRENLEDCLYFLRKNENHFAVDFLGGEESRQDYYLGSLTEFIAEMYMMYVTQGDKLQNFIKSLPNSEKAVWNKVYDIFKRNFDDIEYR